MSSLPGLAGFFAGAALAGGAANAIEGTDPRATMLLKRTARTCCVDRALRMSFSLTFPAGRASGLEFSRKLPRWQTTGARPAAQGGSLAAQCTPTERTYGRMTLSAVDTLGRRRISSRTAAGSGESSDQSDAARFEPGCRPT